jgi:hypothetical protein
VLKVTLVAVGAAMVIASVVLNGADGQSSDGKRVPEMVEIDGSKNPELIPEWSAWSFAFRVLATGSRQLPSSVHVVLSKEEAALLLKEADRVQRFDRECQSRIVKLHASVGKEKDEVVDARLREITVECRWAALHARDRVLEQLRPESGAALAAFVGSTKAATSLTIRKQDLSRFLEPQ